MAASGIAVDGDGRWYRSQETVVDLTFGTKSDHLAVTDESSSIIFRVRQGMGNRQLVVDEGATDNPLISMKAKAYTANQLWQAFRGDSSKPEDLLFTVKKNSMIQRRTELDVFLAANTSKKEADFKIKGNYETKTCTVYEGPSSMEIAQMSRYYKDIQSVISSEEVFGVIVYPGIDMGFITALIAVLCEIKRRESIAKEAATVAGRATIKAVEIGLSIGQIVSNKKKD